MSRDYAGHRVLITGAGAGIGALMAEKFAAWGAEAIITARNLNEDIRNSGVNAHRYVLDVTEIDSIPAFRDRLHHRRSRQQLPFVGRIEKIMVCRGAVVVHCDVAAADGSDFRQFLLCNFPKIPMPSWQCRRNPSACVRGATDSPT